MDICGKIYIAKPLRQCGLTDTVEILPNSKCAVIFRAGTSPKELIESLKVIIADLKTNLKATETPGAEKQ
jgi:hypothetical protein